MSLDVTYFTPLLLVLSSVSVQFSVVMPTVSADHDKLRDTENERVK